MPHKLFLITRQKTKTTNGFTNDMSTDIKLSKTLTSKANQSGGSFGSWLDNIGKKVLTIVAIPFPLDDLSILVTNIASNAIKKIERKISENRAARTGKGITLFISNEDINDIIKIVKSLEHSLLMKLLKQ